MREEGEQQQVPPPPKKTKKKRKKKSFNARKAEAKRNKADVDAKNG